MTQPDDQIIQPQQAPLSHLAQANTRPARKIDWRIGSVVLAVGLVIVIALYILPAAAPVVSRSAIPPSPSQPLQGNADASQQRPAPFAQSQLERAREQAQTALAAFVEKQILLEDTMSVSTWGVNELQQAMSQAQYGDEEFLAERFETALTAYDEARAQLDQLISRGDEMFAAHLATATTSIKSLDPASAKQQLQQAALIKPGDDKLTELQSRAELLPEIIVKLRDAKNHELGGRWGDALAVYDEIATLDPDTTGLAERRIAAARQQEGSDVTRAISRGFNALQALRFEQARTAFNEALRLEPSNDIAAGGLQQVAQQYDLDLIRRYQSAGAKALGSEGWQEAIEAYNNALQLDGNLQFAINGKATASEHQRANRLLSRIVDAPQKLSSEKLYLDASNILDNARALEHSGPKLSALISQVEELLQLYRDPVDVVLLSDNATEVIVSNVGRLGLFDRKTLSLRPGQYTIRGSQDGCRDIFMSIDVLPGIAPVDVSCADRLAR